MSYKTLLWIVLALFLIGGGTAIVVSQQSGPSEVAQEEEMEESAAKAVGHNVSFVITEGERKKWRIQVEEAHYFEDQSGADLRGVKGEFFNKDGKVMLVFTAPTGQYVNKQNQVQLTGGVDAQSTEEKDKVHMTAPKMSWSAKTDEVLAEGGVNLKHKMGTSTANRCRFTLDLATISLEGNVTSKMDL